MQCAENWLLCGQRLADHAGEGHRAPAAVAGRHVGVGVGVAAGVGVTVGTLSSAAIASAFLCSLSTFFLCWSSRVSASISRINRIITIIRSFISLFFFLFRFCFPLFVIDKSASPLLFLVRYYPTVRLLILFHPSNRYRVYMVKFQWKLSDHQVCGISVM